VKGINRVVISGNVGHNIARSTTRNGTAACSFFIASEREMMEAPAGSGETVTTWIRVNAYGPRLANICANLLRKGSYAIVEGELMNRRGDRGDDQLLEVRAHDIVVVTDAGRGAARDDVRSG
jgi:single stranded DNA-binding protein